MGHSCYIILTSNVIKKIEGLDLTKKVFSIFNYEHIQGNEEGFEVGGSRVRAPLIHGNALAIVVRGIRIVVDGIGECAAEVDAAVRDHDAPPVGDGPRRVGVSQSGIVCWPPNMEP